MNPTPRISSLKYKTQNAERWLSVEQARLITEAYRSNGNLSIPLKRALALRDSLLGMPICIDNEELIVGNRTPDIRAGVVFPEAGISWLSGELNNLPHRPQDPFLVREEDADYIRDKIIPFWKGNTLEDSIHAEIGDESATFEKVVKINQKDHAQGHICPDVAEWLRFGPSGLAETVKSHLRLSDPEKKEFYESVIITLEAASDFIRRYSELAKELADKTHDSDAAKNLTDISLICAKLAVSPAESFREALQSVWFLFVILQMESNASSFSPGRMDQYLYRYFRKDIYDMVLTREQAVELLDALYIKFNQIVYMRNAKSAKYFAGFPIGFNITIGGVTTDGKDAVNELSYLFLAAQDDIRMPQPNLTARISKVTPANFLEECTRIIGIGTGMPQVVNDESIVPSLVHSGINHEDAVDYCLVGCVELSTNGNYLGWSDAAMFNLVKVLELTLNDGICMITGKRTGLPLGSLEEFTNFDNFEKAYAEQICFFADKMISACEAVERHHQEKMPSPFLSSVIQNCIDKGLDVTKGGAKYNLSGIQAIQVANVADSIAVIRKLIFEDCSVKKAEMLHALRNNFKGNEKLRQRCITKVEKYGNDCEWVDELGAKWIRYFSQIIGRYTNYRGGAYHTGLYTVSAHVPMGENVAATPDGRLAGLPLADGGLSPMAGRDKNGPTAVLRSVARIPSLFAGNGTLLNMKFLPSFFSKQEYREKFSSLLRSLVLLPVHHVQFNVITNEELRKAREDPESYRGLTVRVAGYTAYFVELAPDLQDEIINRTHYGDN